MRRPATLSLTCAQGIAAGTPLSLTLSSGQPYPFSLSLTLTYNARDPMPTTETVTLTSPLAPAPTVAYQPGWNLVGVPEGTALTGTVGPLYTVSSGDEAYRTVRPGSPLQGGAGYWAFFPTAATVTLPADLPQPSTVELPPGQWVLLGNPFDFTALVFPVSAEDLVLNGYDPHSGQYVRPSAGGLGGLAPGQGAWAFSASGGTVQFTLLPTP